MDLSRVLPLRSDEQSDAELVAAARGGDPWAMGALFARYARMVNNLAYRLLGRDTDKDDVVQDSFVQALTSLRTLQDPSAFPTWLCSLVVRTTHKFLRRRRLLTRLGLRRPEPIDLDQMIAPSASPELISELKALYVTIDAFPAELRLVLLLRRVEGMTLEEIAATTGTSLSTTKRRWVKAEHMFTASQEVLQS